MEFIVQNIGFIILGLCALGVLSNVGGGGAEDEADDTAWIYSKENTCGPNYEGI